MTSYNQPRRVNVVSVLLLLLAVGAGYAGYKFVPVYWKARKVDEALDEEKMRAASFHRMTDDVRQGEAEKIVAKAATRLYEMGIDDQPDQPLQVWFSPDYEELHAKYQVVVNHPFGKPTVLTMDRVREVPRD